MNRDISLIQLSRVAAEVALLAWCGSGMVSCSGPQERQPTCVVRPDWEASFTIGSGDRSILALARDDPSDDVYASELEWPAVGLEPEMASSIELWLQPSESVALVLLPEGLCQEDRTRCRSWSRSELEETPLRRALSGGALLMARLGPSEHHLSFDEPMPPGQLHLVRLTPQNQRRGELTVRGRVALRWAAGSRECFYSRPAPPRLVAGYPWIQACGNGVIEPGEACDDGDLEAGDGCSLSCAVEVATCPTDGPPGHWDTWTCDNTREPTPCQPTRCTPESRAPVCQRRHQVRVVIRAHGRSEAAQPAARVRAPGIGIDCACLDGASTETCLDACHVEATPCSRAVLEVELREDVRLVGWETRGEPECGPDRQRCLVPTDGAIDAVVKVHVPYMVEPVLQLRYRCNHLAPARGGGFLVAGGSYELEQTDDGERNLFIGNIDRVEDDLRQRWTARLPYNMYAASLASDGSGGAVATVTTNEAVTLNEMSFSERGEGLIAFDHRGQWRWGKVLALGVHRTPHRIAVEPSPSGRIAVAIRDIVGQQISGDGSSSDQWGVRVWIFTPDGRQQASFFRRWYNAVGLAWPRPDRLLILGDRWGELDPAQRLIPRTEGSDSVDPVEPGLIGVVELVDPRSGQIYWRREWRRLTQGWEAVPAVGAEGAVSFIDIFTEDQAVERVHGVLPQRLVVLDATTGAVQRTRLLDSPRHCPSLYRIASDPRNGDWLMTQLRECAGSVERHPTAILVERAALDGRTRWTEVIGRPNVEGTRVERSRTPRISVIETAVSESGHTALIGSAGFSWILGQRINDDLRHFMLVISP